MQKFLQAGITRLQSALYYTQLFKDTEPGEGSSVLFHIHPPNLDAKRASSKDENREQYFWRNDEADELITVYAGRGAFVTQFGVLSFAEGDRVVIPKGIIYKINFDEGDHDLEIIETAVKVFYKGELRPPTFIGPIDRNGDFIIKVKNGESLKEIRSAYHPLDTLGWEGSVYPFALASGC